MVDENLAEKCRRWVEGYCQPNEIRPQNTAREVRNVTRRTPQQYNTNTQRIMPHMYRNLVISGLCTASFFIAYLFWGYITRSNVPKQAPRQYSSTRVVSQPQNQPTQYKPLPKPRVDEITAKKEAPQIDYYATEEDLYVKKYRLLKDMDHCSYMAASSKDIEIRNRYEGQYKKLQEEFLETKKLLRE